MSVKQDIPKKILAVIASASMIAGGTIVSVGAVNPSVDTLGVIGSFTNWSYDYIMSDDDGDGVFTVQITLDAGSYEWKVRANSSWDDSWGMPDEDGFTWNSFINCSIEVEQEGIYEFSIDTNGDELEWLCNATLIDNDFKYEVMEDGTIAITGYQGTDTDIVIPNEIDGKTVTSIGDLAFFSCDSLTSVEIPNSVTSIGYRAFSCCDSLTSINVDENNKVYASQDGVLFSKDKTTLITYPVGKSLTNYTIPDSVTSIGDYAFGWCTSLTSIEIPNSVTAIGDDAFFGCTSLTSIKIPNSVTSISRGVFWYCTSLTSIEIPNSVTSISDCAFSRCYGLTSVEIPNSVTSIGACVFSYCTSLTSIEIPNSVTSIGEEAFGCCDSLTSINVDENNEVYASQDGVLFSKDKTTLITYPVGKSLTNYTIPDSVTSIGSDAFWGCASLTSIKIPNSVTSIGTSAFCGCTSLTSIEIPNSVTSIGDEAFWGCTSLTSIEIPNSVTSIGDDAFRGCIDDFKIYGVSGSVAETYANDNGFEFVAITEEPSKSSDIETSQNSDTSESDTSKNTDVPTTGDTSLLFVVIAVVTALSGAIVFLTSKKYKINK